MLLPRFSLKTLLGAMTAFAVLALVGSMAVQGHAWALGVIGGIGAMAATLLAFVALYAGSLLAATVVEILRSGKPAQSPFADARMPTTQVRPEDPFGGG